ncbi:hypothetical protein ACTWJ8_00025 [Streptomyces sp. SDT5-1]|uniref:hypothetical protein n=1 Tax=Streptomyces sp. SDT5-1 TaxID=3406418 RepID=UPI003FD3DB3E
MGARVRDVVRDVVAEVAPEEVLLLDKLTNLDDERLTRLFASHLQNMEPDHDVVGVDVTAAVTPVVWTAVDEAARGANAGGRTMVDRLLGRPRPAPVIRPRSTAHLESVRHLVRERARAARLGEDAATALAEAVAARLALELTDAG